MTTKRDTAIPMRIGTALDMPISQYLKRKHPPKRVISSNRRCERWGSGKATLATCDKAVAIPHPLSACQSYMHLREGNQAMAKQQKFEWSKTPDEGETFEENGFRYAVVEAKHRTNADGTDSCEVVLRGWCAECGREYEQKTWRKVWGLKRRCSEHNMGWQRAHPHKDQPAGPCSAPSIVWARDAKATPAALPAAAEEIRARAVKEFISEFWNPLMDDGLDAVADALFTKMADFYDEQYPEWWQRLADEADREA